MTMDMSGLVELSTDKHLCWRVYSNISETAVNIANKELHNILIDIQNIKNYVQNNTKVIPMDADVYSEIKGYNRKRALNQIKEIYNTTLEILKKAKLDRITTHSAALQIAEKRISDRRINLLNA